MHRTHLLAVHGVLADRPHIAHHLIALHGSPSAALEALASGVADHPDLDGAGIGTVATARSDAARTLDDAHAAGVHIITYKDPAWPVPLNALGQDMPLALFVRGNPDLLATLGSAIAITGSRSATGYGCLIAAELATYAANHGHAVVNGGAYGVDAAALRASLHTATPPIVFTGAGAAIAHPPVHADLFDTIVARGGAVVSEHGLRTAPTHARFRQRARLIGAATAATIIVEAAHRSGSLAVAETARRLGRPVGAVPGSVLSATSGGTHALLRDGLAQMVSHGDDVLTLLEP